jgi:signal transduction histidine kinase
MVDILNKELDRLAALLERFLAFARPRSVAVSELHLDDIIDPVVTLVESQASRQDVRVHWERSAPDRIVRGDKEQLTAVIMNLVLNAIQAMPSGGQVTIRSDAALRGKREFIQVSVDDEGPGVPDEMKEKIFEPFVTTKEGGSGLGLAIAARVVDAHGGLLEVARGTRGGAEFRVLLPPA